MEKLLNWIRKEWASFDYLLKIVIVGLMFVIWL